MTIIAPSILAADFLNLENDIKSMEQSGADWLHLDVMDGHFVPNLSFGLPIISAIKQKTNLFLDVHLMISNPTTYIDKYAEVGADSITFHLEAFPMMKGINGEVSVKRAVEQTILKIREKNIKVGMSIKPSTPFSLIEPFVKDIDMLLFMTVEPGFGGQGFLFSILQKIKEADEYRKDNSLNLLFQVDGGINVETGQICKDYNVDVLVAGTAIFGSENRKETIHILKNNPKT